MGGGGNWPFPLNPLLLAERVKPLYSSQFMTMKSLLLYYVQHKPASIVRAILGSISGFFHVNQGVLCC